MSMGMSIHWTGPLEWTTGLAPKIAPTRLNLANRLHQFVYCCADGLVCKTVTESCPFNAQGLVLVVFGQLLKIS